MTTNTPQKSLVWNNHGEKRATAEHNQIYYEAVFHYGQKCFCCEAQSHGKVLFFEYAKTLEDAKWIANNHVAPVDFSLL